MTRAKRESEQLIDRNQPDGVNPGIGSGSHAQVNLDIGRGCEIRHGVGIAATPATLFALLTDADRMMTWLARDVSADPRAGGIFRLADRDGLWIEGIYLKAVRYRAVAFTWGGIEGLRPGQSTVEFTLRPTSDRTLLRLRHSCLTHAAADSHRGPAETQGCCGRPGTRVHVPE